jgi:hypothetical protein
MIDSAYNAIAMYRNVKDGYTSYTYGTPLKGSQSEIATIGEVNGIGYWFEDATNLGTCYLLADGCYEAKETDENDHRIWQLVKI